MRFIKLGPLVFNLQTEIKGIISQGNNKALLLVRDSQMELNGSAAVAMQWLLGLEFEPRRPDGSEFFVFDVLRGFAQRNQLELAAQAGGIRSAEPVRQPTQAAPEQAVSNAHLVEALKDLLGKMTVPGQAPPPNSEYNANLPFGDPANTPPENLPPMRTTPGLLMPPPKPAEPSVRPPKLNTLKIRQAIKAKGSEPPQFFPGEPRDIA